MSMSASNDITLHRWEILDFKNQREIFASNDEVMYSDIFSLTSQSSVLFALRVDPKVDFFIEEAVGVELMALDDKPVKIDVKLWIESVDGQKFGKTSCSACEFDIVGEWYTFDSFSGTSYKKFYDLYSNNEDFIICCELSNLRTQTPVLNLFQAYQQKNWTLYEKGIHDAVIKVEDEEYKILKTFFMAQSEVFQRMFLSNFTEKVTNTVEINDIKKDTMLQLIKWLYTNQIEDEAQIDDLFVVADKYDIEVLKKMCVEIMLDTTNEQNVFSHLTLAAIHNENQLKNVALGIISSMSKDNFSKFAMSQEWAEFNRKHPKVADEILICIREKLDV